MLTDIKIEKGLIFKRTKLDIDSELEQEMPWKLWVSESLRHLLIEKAQNEVTCAQCGIAKTLHRFKKFYYFPKMVQQVKLLVSNCKICKETKTLKRSMQPTIGNEVVTERPFQKVCMDFLVKCPRSKSGNTHIFIVVDHLSKFVFLKAMNESPTNNAIQFLVQEIFRKCIRKSEPIRISCHSGLLGRGP